MPHWTREGNPILFGRGGKGDAARPSGALSLCVSFSLCVCLWPTVSVSFHLKRRETGGVCAECVVWHLV